MAIAAVGRSSSPWLRLREQGTWNMRTQRQPWFEVSVTKCMSRQVPRISIPTRIQYSRTCRITTAKCSISPATVTQTKTTRHKAHGCSKTLYHVIIAARQVVPTFSQAILIFSPSAGGVCLYANNQYQKRLMAASLLDINMKAHAPFLAYLSACGTGQAKDQ